MAWYDEAVFYHIYPLGLTGAPKQNPYGTPEHRLNTLLPWISHIKNIGCNALYIGPLFESVGHGYETTDYKKLDSRLGTNEDLTAFVAECHRQGIRVVLDGVFNHTGRDFFAFQDLKQNREHSAYKDWYCNVNFWGNNEYNDGFSYENWGGHNLLVKLNQHNPAVKDYICEVIRFWVREFDIDGIRLDAADVLDFEYMKALRRTANEVKPDFWLMGEVIHGDYTRWVNEGTLHCVTNYTLHKALYSGHNDHNYFEIAHTVKRLYDMGGCRIDGLRLYNFTDNHDVERIYTKLNKKEHFAPAHILLYTLPGIPSVYYGSEFGIEGRKERHSDDSLRPALSLSDYADAAKTNPCTRLITTLGRIRQRTAALSYGDYKELLLTNRQYAFSRNHDGISVVVTVNNDDSDYVMTLSAGNAAQYMGALSGERVSVVDGRIVVNVKRNSGDIWVPVLEGQDSEPEHKEMPEAPVPVQENKTFSEESTTPSAETVPASSAETSVEKPINTPAAKETSGKLTDTPATEKTVGKLTGTSATKEAVSKPADTPAAETATENPSDASAKTQIKTRKSEATEYWWKTTTADTEGEDPVKIPDEETTLEDPAGTDSEGSVKISDIEADAENSVKASDAETATEDPVKTADTDTETATEDPAKTADAESATENPTRISDPSLTIENSAKASTESETEIFERGRIAGLQEAILAIMEKNGPVTDQMRRDVMENTHHDSLVIWVKSFR